MNTRERSTASSGIAPALRGGAMSMSATAPAFGGRVAALVAAATLLGGCALTSKSEPLLTRYFSPDYIGAPPRQAVPTSSAGAGTGQLRLGDVRGGSHLRERILYRDRDEALGYYEQRRWTERPEDYLRRALARALFEERGMQRVVAGAAPTLEVELVAFEEIRAPRRKVRLEAVILLHDERIVRLEETVTIERPVRSQSEDDVGAVVRALAEALRLSVTYIADRVTAEVATMTPAAPAAAPLSPARDPEPETKHPIEASAIER
jgi:cholesterol transport system auxiliary component